MYAMRYAMLPLALLLAAAPLAAQSAVVDEGSFTITRGRDRIGREDFIVRRTSSPGGDVLVASATVSYNGRRLSPALRADSTGAPLAYQVEVRTGTDIAERLVGQVGRGRFSARVRTPQGESAKEYIVSNGALVLDDDVFHQYYFVARRTDGGSIPVVIPRRNVQVTMRVEQAGSEPVTVGGRQIAARHIVLRGPSGDDRHIWADAQGRVLQVRVGDVTALRDEAPR
jgi:hypothetical protein